MQTKGYDLVETKLSELVPYWRNPRIISDEAVNAVAKSIKDYGYQQPIIVDAENVIIIGHTRYMALKRLGYEAVTVGVATGLTPREVKQLRTIDNRTSEYAEWDMDKLAEELSKLDQGFTDSFFAELAEAEQEALDHASAGESETSAVEVVEGSDLAEFICPKCFYSWEMNITLKAVRSGIIKEA